MGNIEELRLKIDEVDRKLTRLFEERMDISREIAEYKQKKGLPITDENREKIVLEKNIKNTKAEYREQTNKFLKTIMSLSKDVQRDWITKKDKCFIEIP